MLFIHFTWRVLMLVLGMRSQLLKGRIPSGGGALTPGNLSDAFPPSPAVSLENGMDNYFEHEEM